MRRGALAALVAGSLVAAAVGFVVMERTGGGSSGTARGAVDLSTCPIDGATRIGHLAAGDRVWLIGVTDDRWAVIRTPDDPSTPAWAPLAMIDTAATTRDLPEVRCGGAMPTTATVPTTLPTATVPGVTTTTLATTVTSTTSTTAPTTTLPSDTTPPTVTVTANRSYLYVVTPIAPCSAEDDLEVTITVADPSLPVSIRSIVATWDVPSGPQTANLSPVGGTRFRLEVPSNGPLAGETPLTLTATASDGVGNVGTGTLVVALRDPSVGGCV